MTKNAGIVKISCYVKMRLGEHSSAHSVCAFDMLALRTSSCVWLCNTELGYFASQVITDVAHCSVAKRDARMLST